MEKNIKNYMHSLTRISENDRVLIFPNIDMWH